MICGQFGHPFLCHSVAFWRSGATVKTVLPPVRESYFHILSARKKVFLDSALSVPACGDTFDRFLTILASIWRPGGSILAPQGAFLGDRFWCPFLDTKKGVKKRDCAELRGVRRSVRNQPGRFRGVTILQTSVGVVISGPTRCDPPTGGQRI